MKKESSFLTCIFPIFCNIFRYFALNQGIKNPAWNPEKLRPHAGFLLVEVTGFGQSYQNPRSASPSVFLHNCSKFVVSPVLHQLFLLTNLSWLKKWNPVLRTEFHLLVEVTGFEPAASTSRT